MAESATSPAQAERRPREAAAAISLRAVSIAFRLGDGTVYRAVQARRGRGGVRMIRQQ